MSTASAPDLGPTGAEQARAPSSGLSGTAPATSPSLAPVALPPINLQGVSSLTPKAQQGVINAVAETLGVPASQLSLQQPGAAGPTSAAATSVRSAPAGRRLMQVGLDRWDRQHEAALLSSSGCAVSPTAFGDPAVVGETAA